MSGAFSGSCPVTIEQNTQQLTGAVVGLGKIGLLHAALVEACADAKLIAVSDPGSGLLRSALETFGNNIRAFKSHHELLAWQKPDFAFIASPPDSHVEVALDFLNQNVPIFIEKPLCAHASNAEKLLPFVRQNNNHESPVVTMVGFMMRYHEVFRRVKVLLSKNVLGPIVSFRGSTYVSQQFKAGKGWKFNPKSSGGGVLITQGIHLLDLLVWYFGFPITVNARTSSFYSESVEDFANVILEFPSGHSGPPIIGSLESSWSVDNHRMVDTMLEVRGEKGTLSVNDDGLKIYLREENAGLSSGWTFERKVDLFEGASVDIGGTHYTRQDEAFIHAVRSKTSIETDLYHGYKIQLLIDLIYESARKKGAPQDFRTDKA